jgi:site-specific DNA recombinase
MYRANYTYLSEDGKQMFMRPEHEWIVSQVEPIVGTELWELCNSILDGRKAAREPQPGPRTVHLFAGYIFCQCGEKMYVKDNTPKYVCRKCRNKVPVIEMENHFRAHLTGYLPHK